MASNRKGFPEKIKGMVAEYNKKPQGSGVYMRDKEEVYTVWKDTKCVTVGSNQHAGHADDTVLRNWKDKGERKKKDVPIPIPIYNYNKFMGGVDRSDQMIKYVTRFAKTRHNSACINFQYKAIVKLSAKNVFHKNKCSVFIGP